MTLHLTCTAFVDDEEEESDDDVGFGVYGAFKKFAGKVTNKALQGEELPKYSPTSPSLEIEETTLSLSNKELERSRSKGIVTSPCRCKCVETPPLPSLPSPSARGQNVKF